MSDSNTSSEKELFASAIGEQLYRLLPEVYRYQDNAERDPEGRETAPGDLARFLDGAGHLLDLIHDTLEQRLADCFPDVPDSGLSCQDWIIPYFARLVDARLVSPHPEGRRTEVANAIYWRQRKGTLACAEQIAEAVADLEVEIQEGWKRVAVTPRIGVPLVPSTVFGLSTDEYDEETNRAYPSLAARHPGLPAVTVDLRCSSQAIKQEGVMTSATHRTRFNGVEYEWVQANPHGVPEHPGHYDDVSLRTVDVRTPDWRNGHYHHKRLLLYMPTPMGLFPREREAVDTEIHKCLHLNCRCDIYRKDELNYSRIYIKRISDTPVTIDMDITLPEDHAEVLSPKEVEEYSLSTLALTKIEDVSLPRPLTILQGKLVMRGVTAKAVTVKTSDGPALVNELKFEAKDCVIDTLDVDGRVRLDSCTVLGDITCAAIEAYDCIFVGDVQNEEGGVPFDGFIRYSRVSGPDKLKTRLSIGDCTTDEPLFFSETFDTEESDGGGCAVLKPGAPDAICFGASNGGEMGAYHRGREGRPVLIKGNFEIDALTDNGYVLRDLVFDGKLSVSANVKSPLRIQRIAAKVFEGLNSLEDDDGNYIPLLYAEDCLFSEIQVTGGLMHLEYCTVLDSIQYQFIHASDCIFMDETMNTYKEGDCIRYSRIPLSLKEKEDQDNNLIFPHCTTEKPLFFRESRAEEDEEENGDEDVYFDQGVNGHPGCGVLHPKSPESVCFGAEDGGEMGAYHKWRYCLRNRAVLVKLKDYLPLGIEPVLIPDERLHVPPGSENEQQTIT